MAALCDHFLYQLIMIPSLQFHDILHSMNVEHLLRPRHSTRLEVSKDVGTLSL